MEALHWLGWKRGRKEDKQDKEGQGRVEKGNPEFQISDLKNGKGGAWESVLGAVGAEFDAGEDAELEEGEADEEGGEHPGGGRGGAGAQEEEGLVEDAQACDFGAGGAGGHGQDVGLGLPGGDEYADEVDDEEGAEGRDDDEKDFVGEGGAVDVGGFVEFFGDAFQGRKVDEASGAHARPEEGEDAGEEGGAGVVEPADGFGEAGGEEREGGCAVGERGEDVAEGGEGAGGENQAVEEGEKGIYFAGVAEEAAGDVEGEEKGDKGEEDPSPGGDGEDDAVGQAGGVGGIKRFPEEDDDESADGGREVDRKSVV